MLQRLIHSARVNVFESAQFYYWVMLTLTIHTTFRHSLVKVLSLNGEAEWAVSKILTGFLYGFIYGCCIITSSLLRKEISKLYLTTWLIITSILAINEFTFFLNSPNEYDLLKSFSSGQGFMAVRLTLPILFLGIWYGINNLSRYKLVLLKIVYKIVIVNSLLVLLGIIFEIPLFKSYDPASSRWGFSGMLNRNYSVILSSMFLINQLQKSAWFRPVPFLLIVSLVGSGTKSGILSLALVILIVLIKSNLKKQIIIGTGSILLILFPKWIHYLLEFNNFWRNVYEEHGPWGVLFSLRNQSFSRLLEFISESYSFKDWLFGGAVRVESLYVEMAPISVFSWTGIIGLIILFRFFYLLVPTWKNSIPLIIACLSGSLIIAPLAFILWGIWGFEGFSNKK